ncbi:helix-turn-helix transcriptional regulator [Paracholeplasma manati]|uniref:AraC family transcriptional regulator n=1 Tax=Paracholeplasma manati TaxID=591373 RepID=A0ABT2Y5K5_9MOLU|nr:AraC family transcriptional regulator [Paracholeplasma manati]MCV2231270.1 AraC family transcriptional regulator [Paracholeplasma manati]MDG0888348.1 AraC family transcriptional regulator [Paracholeplasma manati]
MAYNYNFNNFKFSHKIDFPDSKIDNYEKHSHAVFEFLYFIEGEVDFYIESRKYTLKPHDLLFIKPGEHHHMIIIKPVRYDRMVIRFPEYIIPNILLSDINRNTNVYNIKDTPLIPVLKRFDEYNESFTGDRLQLMFYTLLTELLILFSSIDGNNGAEAEIIDVNVSNIIDYINSNINRQISIDDICKQFFLSKSKLYKIFFDVVKVPIVTYIRSKRIILAHKLITEGHSPIEIYERCGYSHYSTFYRTYLKVFGVPPSKGQ